MASDIGSCSDAYMFKTCLMMTLLMEYLCSKMLLLDDGSIYTPNCMGLVL